MNQIRFVVGENISPDIQHTDPFNFLVSCLCGGLNRSPHGSPMVWNERIRSGYIISVKVMNHAKKWIYWKLQESNREALLRKWTARQRPQQYLKKKPRQESYSCGASVLVEVAGVEPASEMVTHQASTCLAVD